MNKTLILSRVPRHISFVGRKDFHPCIWQADFKFETREICYFISSTDSCHMYVFYRDYLRLIYCTFEFTNSQLLENLVTLLVYLIVIFNLLLTYMITKYFFYPNFLTLRRAMPISDYAYGYLCYGILLGLPIFVNLIISCPFNIKHKTTFDFAKILGSIIVLFGIGIMQLCQDHYTVNGCRWWINMSIIIVSYFYLIITVKRKISIYKRVDDISDTEEYLLHNSALFFALMFLVLNVVAAVITYPIGQKASQEIEMVAVTKTRTNEEDGNLKDKQKQSAVELETLHIWKQSVNSFKHMTDQRAVFRYLAAPFFFIVACLVPVIDYERPMYGCSKPILYTSLIAMPFIFLPFKPYMSAFLGLIIISLILCTLVHVKHETLRKPKFLFIYALIGLGLSSTFLLYCAYEIEAITWQWFQFCYHASPDMIAMLLFNLSPLVTQYLIVSCLLKRRMQHMAYGVVVGRVNVIIFTALPMLMLNQCPKPSFITLTAVGETSCFFTLTILVYTLLGISICGYDFRPSFSICQTIMLAVYYAFQLGSLFGLLHPLGTEHTPLVPQTIVNDWA